MPISLTIQNEQEAASLLELLDLAAKTGGIKNNVAGAAQSWAHRILQASQAEAERLQAAAIVAAQKASTDKVNAENDALAKKFAAAEKKPRKPRRANGPIGSFSSPAEPARVDTDKAH